MNLGGERMNVDERGRASLGCIHHRAASTATAPDYRREAPLHQASAVRLSLCDPAGRRVLGGKRREEEPGTDESSWKGRKREKVIESDHWPDSSSATITCPNRKPPRHKDNDGKNKTIFH